MSGEQAKAAGEWSADELIPFGKYILLERIAQGATAAVYRANVRGEPGFERLVAIKRILPHMAGDPEFVNAFVREAKITARLTHQNICPIYELGKVGESLYMAMECVVGRDLGVIRRSLEEKHRTLPAVAAAWIGARLCDALEYAHTLRDQSGNDIGIIHRDLSPTNILISYEGELKLIDFGLAKAVGRAQQTNVDALKEKLGYMSPEMVRGRPLDARSDIFGVGIALYEMLTGRRLFAGKDDIATLQMVGKASVPPPSALLEDPPDELELIIMRALERDADDRWQTAGEMAEVLNAFVREQDSEFSERHMAAFMRELFDGEIDADRARIAHLLEASSDPDVVRQRRLFFSSPTGAVARAKAEVVRRMTTKPPRAAGGGEATLPKAPGVPREAQAADPPKGLFSKPAEVAAGDASPPAEPSSGEETESTPERPDARSREFEEQPTGFYDESAPSDALEEESTGFYDGEEEHPPRANGAGAEEPFGDEPTHYLKETELDELTVEEKYTGGGFDEEEPTTIYFNKEEGVGLPELLEEIHAVDVRPEPLNRPIVAPDIGLPPPAVAPAAGLPAEGAVDSRMRRQTAHAPSAGARAFSRGWSWPVAFLLLALAAAGFAIVLLTPLGVELGLRRAPGGTIEIRTHPPVRAQVTLDGVFRGRSPLRMSGVKPGIRRIGIQAEGFLPVTRQVEVKPDQTSMLEISLVEKPPPRPTPDGSGAAGDSASGNEGGAALEGEDKAGQSAAGNDEGEAEQNAVLRPTRRTRSTANR